MKDNLIRIWNSCNNLVSNFLINNNFSPNNKITRYIRISIAGIIYTLCIIGIMVTSISYCFIEGGTIATSKSY